MLSSRRILDGDDSNVWISNGSKRLRRKVEGSSSAAAIRATIHNFDGNGTASTTAVAHALNLEGLATVFAVVPDVGAGAVASCCEVHVCRELTLIVAITGRGNIWCGIE